ncbi:hypothetical protein [Natrinema salaciae]|nr:hypothetical protein [Natrinema salaciae]
MASRIESATNRSAGRVDSTATAAADDADTLVLEDFSDWPGENRLGEYSSAGALENGDGTGERVGDALRLAFDDDGWFLSNVRTDLSGYSHLELDVRGDDGGEESEVYVEIDDVEAPLGALTDETIDTAFATVRIDLSAVGVDPSSIQDVWLTFWDAGSGAIEIEEIRFVQRDVIPVGEYEARDPDGDGLYNDVDGDGETTHADVDAFYEHLEADGVQDDPDAFDFDGNDRIGFADVLRLLREI